MRALVSSERDGSELRQSEDIHESSPSSSIPGSSDDLLSDQLNHFKPIRRSLYLDIAQESPSSSDMDSDSPLPSEVSVDDDLHDSFNSQPGLEFKLQSYGKPSTKPIEETRQPETNNSPNDVFNLPPAVPADYNSNVLDSYDEPPSSDPNDDFISSDDDGLTRLISGSLFTPLGCGTTFAEHVLYFKNALDNCLDSLQLDKALVAQSQLSGRLIDTNRLLLDKLQELQQSLRRLQELFQYHISSNRIDALDSDLKNIHTRIENLKHGAPKSLFFAKSKLGVMHKFPVEYNQARDRILERPEE